MLKAAIGLLGVALVSLVFSFSVQQGCKDLKRSTTHLSYYPIRDMRTTVVLDPARGFLRDPDTTAIPTGGVDRPLAGAALMTPEERDAFAATFVNPQAADDSSIARGARKFARTCVPCHGKAMAATARSRRCSCRRPTCSPPRPAPARTATSTPTSATGAW